MIYDELRRSVWNGGQLMAFSALDGTTDYNGALTARTAFDSPGIDITLPARGRIRFPGVTRADNLVAGDWFRFDGENPTVGVFLDTHHLLLEGPCVVTHAEAGITCSIAGNRTLIGSSTHFDPGKIAADVTDAVRDRCRWIESRCLPPVNSRAAGRTLIKALSIMKTQVYSPEGRICHRWTTPDRWPHRQMWLWDSAFHAIGWRHIDPELAQDAILAVFDMQAPDGFIPHAMNPAGTSGITQPPVLALSAKLVHDIARDDEWIATVYPRLSACLEWDLRNRDTDGGGLLEWRIDGDPLCRSGESGMDNSPRFDAATRLDAVDFNSFFSLECQVMAGFAHDLGLADHAAKWTNRHREMNRLIGARLWSDEAGFFVDYDTERRAPSSVLASSGFLPLICGAASKGQAARLAECLADPTMFGTAFPVPSIAAHDARHYAKDMWRGPTWININWMIARGFERYGFDDLAERLRFRTMKEIEDEFERSGTLFEFYDDRLEVAPPRLLRKGKCAPDISPYHQVVHDYGWTASLYVDLAYTGNHGEHYCQHGSSRPFRNHNRDDTVEAYPLPFK